MAKQQHSEGPRRSCDLMRSHDWTEWIAPTHAKLLNGLKALWAVDVNN
jgi:hypothetical protein